MTIVENPTTDLTERELVGLRAANRRLQEEIDRLTGMHNTSLLAENARLKITVLNQQIQLTQLNTAMHRKNRRTAKLREQLDRYRRWAGAVPLDLDKSLMASTMRRIAILTKENAQQRTQD